MYNKQQPVSWSRRNWGFGCMLEDSSFRGDKYEMFPGQREVEDTQKYI